MGQSPSVLAQHSGSRKGVDKVWPTHQIQPTTCSVYKALLEYSHTHRLHIIYGCFHAIVVELSSCDETTLPMKPKVFTISPFSEKFADPGLERSDASGSRQSSCP